MDQRGQDEAVVTAENFDPLWYQYNAPVTSLEHWYRQSYRDGYLRISDVSAALIHEAVMDGLSRKSTGEILPKTKENPDMSYNDDDRLSDQDKIDAAVREALAAPRREAEIARRVALVSVLEKLDLDGVGTVITFEKKSDRSDKVTVLYVAIKTGPDEWKTTGDGRYSNGTRYNFQQLLEWLTTGPNLVENVQKATGFAPVVSESATK